MFLRLLPRVGRLLPALLVALSIGLVAGVADAKRIERSFNLQGVKRSYIAYLPDDLSAKSSWPVLFAFHPGGASGRVMERSTGLHKEALAKNYIVVYPSGYKRLWNAGYCCGEAQQRGIDDIAFVQAIMSDLRTMAPIQPKIYATGFSNGSLLVYYMLCKRSDLLRAAAPYAAVLDWERVSCNPTTSVPILHMQGTDDPRAPYDGGRTDNLAVGYHQPVPAAQDFWASKFDCSSSRSLNLVPNSLACQAKVSCDSGAQVVICPIPGIGHIWPGDRENFITRRMGLGEARTDINGSRVVLNFFEQYRN